MFDHKMFDHKMFDHMSISQSDDYLVGCNTIVCVSSLAHNEDIDGGTFLTEGKEYGVINVGSWLVSVVDDSGTVGAFDKRRFVPYKTKVEPEPCVKKSKAYIERMKKNKLFGIF